MTEFWKTRFEPIDLDQKFYFWRDGGYEVGKFTAYVLFQEELPTLFSFHEQRFFSLIYSGGEMILGVDHYCDKKRNKIYIRYTYRCPADLDPESTEYLVKALFQKQITGEITRKYKLDGITEPKVECFKFIYSPDEEKALLDNGIASSAFDFDQDLAIEGEDYCSVNTWPVYRAFPDHVFEKEENRYYTLITPANETVYVGVIGNLCIKTGKLRLRYIINEYANSVDQEVLEYTIKALIHSFVALDYQNYYKNNGLKTRRLIAIFQKPINPELDPDETGI